MKGEKGHVWRRLGMDGRLRPMLDITEYRCPEHLQFFAMFFIKSGMRTVVLLWEQFFLIHWLSTCSDSVFLFFVACCQRNKLIWKCATLTLTQPPHSVCSYLSVFCLSVPPTTLSDWLNHVSRFLSLLCHCLNRSELFWRHNGGNQNNILLVDIMPCLICILWHSLLTNVIMIHYIFLFRNIGVQPPVGPQWSGKDILVH